MTLAIPFYVIFWTMVPYIQCMPEPEIEREEGYFVPPLIEDERKDSDGHCLNHTRACWDGSYVERNIYLDCMFNKCPGRLQCDTDMLKCPDGSYIIRNPWKECHFHVCPKIKVRFNQVIESDECPHDME